MALRYATNYWATWSSYYGSNNSEYVFGSNNSDYVYGFDGHDVLYGYAGNDFMYGGNGTDWLFGGSGRDYLTGEAGNDNLYGEEGNDLLYGGDGDDWLIGGTGQDFLHGQAGQDTIVFNSGDTYAQSSNADILLWDAADRVVGASGGYVEFSADVTSVEDAYWYANTYYGLGWLPANTGNVYIQSTTVPNTGYLLMDLDNDPSNSFESAVTIGGADLSEIGASNFI
jgi:Ca2+-binding RTX toxin-like protein